MIDNKEIQMNGIPYMGSKRKIASEIVNFIRQRITKKM